MEDQNIKIGHLTACLTIFLWGTTFIATKILLQTFTPLEILFIRFFMGFIALTLFFPRRLHITDKKQEFYFIGAGICGITLYFLLENIALTYTFATNVGIMISVSPFFTAIFAHFFTRNERFSPSFILGFLTAMVGIFLISLNGATTLKLNPLGDILAILAAIVWAIYSLLTKKISTFGYHTIATTRRIFFYGILFMLPLLPIANFHVTLADFKNPINLWNLIFLGLGASALCFVTWNYAVKILGAIKTSIYVYVCPVVTVITSALILKEKITLITVLGIALTLSGLFLSEGKFIPIQISTVLNRNRV